MIVNSLQLGLSLILSGLKGEFVGWLVPWLITPVANKRLSVLLLFGLGSTEEVLPPGHSPIQEVPVCVTIERCRADEAPEYPPHLPDHPHVSFSHVVRDVEHHVVLFNKDLI